VIPVKSNRLSPEERRLLEQFAALDGTGRDSLLAFAEFLVQRAAVTDVGQGVEPLPQPEPIPRPEQESVIAAMRRLSATYPMIDRSVLLNEASGLMGAHVLHGRAAPEVIDELESLFRRAYEELLAGQQEA
jgi:hypothetical protein